MKKEKIESIEIVDHWLLMKRPHDIVDEINDFAVGMKNNRYHRQDNEITLNKRIPKDQSVPNPHHRE